jgi:hypothetical protein
MGATENFINLDYAKYLRLPIKQFDKPQLLVKAAAMALVVRSVDAVKMD